MTDPSRYLDSGDETTAGSKPKSADGLPRWVKIFATVAVIIVLLLAVTLLVGGGEHGPSRHSHSGDAGRPIFFSSVAGFVVPL